MTKKVKAAEPLGKLEQIIEVAGKMFMSEGYGAVSMDKLALAVPVSKRTLYNHFKDKKALFVAVMGSRCQSIFSQLQESIKQDIGVEKTLTFMAEQYLNRVLEPSAVSMYRVAITESKHFPELSLLFYDYGPKRGTELMTSYFADMTKAGKLKVTNPELAAKVFLGMISNRIQMEFMLGVRTKITPKEKAEIVSFAIKTFLHGNK